jgi:hypothetical protein
MGLLFDVQRWLVASDGGPLDERVQSCLVDPRVGYICCARASAIVQARSELAPTWKTFMIASRVGAGSHVVVYQETHCMAMRGNYVRMSPWCGEPNDSCTS